MALPSLPWRSCVLAAALVAPGCHVTDHPVDVLSATATAPFECIQDNYLRMCRDYDLTVRLENSTDDNTIQSLGQVTFGSDLLVGNIGLTFDLDCDLPPWTLDGGETNVIDLAFHYNPGLQTYEIEYPCGSQQDTLTTEWFHLEGAPGPGEPFVLDLWGKMGALQEWQAIAEFAM